MNWPGETCVAHCRAGERRTAFTATVDAPRHAHAAGALVHLPPLVGVIDRPLVETRRLRLYGVEIKDKHDEGIKHECGAGWSQLGGGAQFAPSQS